MSSQKARSTMQRIFDVRMLQEGDAIRLDGRDFRVIGIDFDQRWIWLRSLEDRRWEKWPAIRYVETYGYLLP